RREFENTRLLTMHDTETIGDESITERRQLLCERLAFRVVLGCLTRVETKILEHGDLSIFERVDNVARGRPHSVRRKSNSRTEQLAQANGDRLETVPIVLSTFRSSQVGEYDHARPRVRQRRERRQ